MKKIPLILFLVLFFSFCSLSFGQIGPTLTLQLAPSLELAQIVYVSDFDFIQQGATQFLFQLNVDNTGRGSLEGLLRFEIFQNENMLAETQTQPFILTANENFSISNIELNTGYMVESGQIIVFDKANTINPSSDFENEVQQSGKLPKGNYHFIVKFLYAGGESPAPPQTIFVHNPTFVRPIMPGTRNGSGYLEILYTQFPTFQFESDFDAAFAAGEPFHVQIFKKLEQHSSIDEVLTSTPHFDEWMPQTVFPYPPAAVLPLDPGVYVWRVQLQLVTTSGTEILESPIFAFQIEDPSTLGEFGDDGVQDDILRILVDMLGDRGRQIAQSLSNYKLRVIRVNGETITKKEFYRIIENYETSETEREILDILFQGSQE